MASIKTDNGEGRSVRIREDGQATRRKTTYYDGGYVKNLEILNELKASSKIVENYELINKTITRYEKISPYIFPVLTVDGIFDRVWRSMGMSNFSYHFKKNTTLYRELIKFYAHLTQTNLRGLVNATGKRGKVINILDDVAYKDRSMISPKRWETDFMPYYKEINSLISDANMISQIHTDGDATELISSFKKAGFQGLQGFEGGCDPYYINEQHPDFVIVGFGNECIAYPLQREVELYKPEEFFRRLGEYHGYKDLGYYFAVDDVNGNVKYVDESSSFVIDNENGDVRFVSEFSLLEIERIMDIWAFCTTTNSITTNEL